MLLKYNIRVYPFLNGGTEWRINMSKNNQEVRNGKYVNCTSTGLMDVSYYLNNQWHGLRRALNERNEYRKFYDVKGRSNGKYRYDILYNLNGTYFGEYKRHNVWGLYMGEFITLKSRIDKKKR